MGEGLFYLFSARPLTQILRDVLDVFIVAYILYRALLVVRGTRAIQMGAGLGVVFLVYLAAKYIGLVTLLNILNWLLGSIILIVVVVFQNDIRRALTRMGARAWLSGGREQQSRVIDEVVAAATELARHRMGAIIAFEQDANVLEFAKSEGIPLDSTVTRELLVTLFVPEQENKLHDGAVLIRDLKIARAGVFFPMPETKILDAALGSRHRAALGITEETDAVVVVVSEERGTISFCFSGNIVSNLDGQSLRHALLALFGRSTRKKRFARKVASGTPAGPRPTIPVVTPRPSMAVPPPAPPPPAAGGTTLTSRVLFDAATAAVAATATPLPSGKPLAPSKRTLSEPMRPSGEMGKAKTESKADGKGELGDAKADSRADSKADTARAEGDPETERDDRISAGRVAVEPPEPASTGERASTPRTTFVPTPSSSPAENKAPASATPVPGEKS